MIGRSAAARALGDTPPKESQEAYALLWSVWRIGDPEALLAAFRRSVLSLDGTADPLVHGFLLAIAGWQANAAGECGLEAAISASLPPGALRGAVCPLATAAAGLAAAGAPRERGVEEAKGPLYRRLARLLEATAAAGGGAEDVLRSIESFGHVSSWLKVAGGSKAAVLAGALGRRAPLAGEVALELGAFVGYSALRFARQLTTLNRCNDHGRLGACLGGISLEIDPVHAAVSRHHVDLAGLAGAAEIWVGQLQDTMPRTVEACGADSLAFVFMDQRGTTFHEDLAGLECLSAMAPLAHVTADNTVKPGAPVYLWHVVVGARGNFLTELWALEEFALDAIEDWQSVSLLRHTNV